ncbi:MAG: hypothetical protein UX91_C0009G0018 [Candidatus Amesbacteria bacterium GW2011_GWB1_47_19]|nr:MAG: hypothetical protein UW51_C0008G0020 [Candidatus Amesbacteria bacterium GW2011_GWA1_44_24]KKU30949.1 MAG: hypothetical protein UX46_C0009G0025 [Candidatus Amesbacteria bacterium GW2011_GWC1_46_24]KKU66612.1 MAG: hypothetical protein UX91_C0009G0018 [Candidatus Amesbacteria bacterium GW2011_GWB1_47_19]OGD05332.1 MAG: hypothetical protein A2379_01250 [Candidatus Amesbacteria bacterium RIFOXYB1_FULL_47_13]HBC73213.1 hypothetical protein [Candidatus Amesbacteria bacterium]
MKKKLFYLIVLANIVFVTGQYTLTGLMAGDGEEFGLMQDSLNELTVQNRLLESRINSLSSTLSILDRVERLGLFLTQISYLQPVPVAILPQP